MSTLQIILIIYFCINIFLALADIAVEIKDKNLRPATIVYVVMFLLFGCFFIAIVLIYSLIKNRHAKLSREYILAFLDSLSPETKAKEFQEKYPDGNFDNYFAGYTDCLQEVAQFIKEAP